MSDDRPLVRQWRLLQILSAYRQGLTVKEMAHEANVSLKTIRRDLDVFTKSGFPLIEEVGKYGRKIWRLANRPELNFSFDEAVAFYLAQHLLEPLAGTPFWQAAQSAFKKIRKFLGAEALKYAERFTAMFYHTAIGVSDYSKKTELIDRLMIGIEDRKAVFITYQSLKSSEAATYEIYPYGIIYHHGSLYLIGYSCRHKEIRRWKVDRIEAVELSGRHAEWPADFNLKQHLARSFGIFQGNGNIHVKVRFAPTVARYVKESTWHESQKLTEQPDGSLLAEFDLESTEEIMRWILGFGQHAEVLEPTELCQKMLQEITAMTTFYQQNQKTLHRNKSHQ